MLQAGGQTALRDAIVAKLLISGPHGSELQELATSQGVCAAYLWTMQLSLRGKLLAGQGSAVHTQRVSACAPLDTPLSLGMCCPSLALLCLHPGCCKPR